MLYTIGHSNHSIEKFLLLLKQYNINKIVDVRSYPNSKYNPQFNKDNLAQSLLRNNIDYLWMGWCLGGLWDDKDLYTDGKLNVDKMEKMETYQNGIKNLINMGTINAEKTAIMCSEENPEKCHRGYVICQTLIDYNCEVWHIRGDGNLEEVKKIIKQIIKQINLFEKENLE